MRGNSRAAAARRPKKMALFLEALADTVNVALACKRAGVPRRTVYEWRERDAEFDRRWQEALDEGIDLLEAELHRRAFEGVERPVFYKGRQVGTWHYYSDALAMFLLRAHRPRKYKHHVVEERKPGEIAPEVRERVHRELYQSILDHNRDARQRRIDAALRAGGAAASEAERGGDPGDGASASARDGPGARDGPTTAADQHRS